jgi:hypothetical protein
MATYVNNLRLKEIATGAETGTWGTSTNTNLELIADALGSGTEGIITNADTHTTTIADGAADEGRALFLKYTGSLDSACTITLAPNTINKLWFIENATSGSQNIIISQGSGANITIGAGKVAVVFTDGAGAGAAVLDALTDLVVSDSLQVAGPTLTVGDAAAEDTKVLFDGNAKDFYVGLDDSADKLVIGEGSTVGTNSILTMTDDTVTVGDGAAVDTSIVYDGNAKDFYIGLDDSADKLVIGEGSTVGTNGILTMTDDTVTIGDGAAVDTSIVYDGNAKDFYIGLDDSADKLVIGEGSTVGTTPAISIDENVLVTMADDLTLISDSAVLGFGVDTDITLTHVHNAGLTLNRDLRFPDDEGVMLGTGQDATFQYNGTHAVIKPNAVGSGALVVSHAAGTIPSLDSSATLIIQRNSTTGRDVRLDLLCGNDAQAVINFGDAEDEDAGMITYSNTSNFMSFRTNTAERMRIDSSGNVGIGVTSVSYKLDVSGTVRLAGLPTSDPGVASALWNDSNTLKISAG